jgi:2-iminobutanoate/2-iminopropanoate deaminase
MRRRIEPDPDTAWESAAKAFLVDGTIYLSGQVGLTRQGTVVGRDMKSQARQALENIKEILGAAGATMNDVVALTLYFKDGCDTRQYFEVAKSYFPVDPPPATGVLVAGLLQPELLIEIAAVAVISE